MEKGIVEIGNRLIPVVAYGDAAGLPYEIKTRDEVLQLNNGREVTELTSGHNKYIGDLQLGDWSDDTQLSLVVAESLMDSNGFDLKDLANKHIEAYRVSTRGWGGSTQKAVESLMKGVAPENSGLEKAGGNGILMKMAPLVFWQYASGAGDFERWESYDLLTSMTHDNTVSRLCTRVHGDILKHLLEYGYEKEPFINKVKRTALLHERLLRVSQGERLTELILYLDSVESLEGVLSNTDAKGFYAPQTIAMAYGAFILSDGRINEAVYNGVNLGGDTDSLASIAGSMALMSINTSIEMPADIERVKNIERLRCVSAKLTDQALRLFEASR